MEKSHHLRTLTAILTALLLPLAMPAAAQTDRVTGEARRFLVYPVADLIDFAEREKGQFGLSYQVSPIGGKDAWRYYFNVNAVRLADEKEAVSFCNEQISWHRGNGYQVSSIGGYACAFVADKRLERKADDGAVIKSQLRSTGYVVGAYFGELAEAAIPPRQEFAPVGPLLAALKGEQPLSPGEVAFRNVLFRTGLKFGGDAARSCLDEVMNTAEATAAKDPKMADEIAQLRKAAARAHAIEVLAALPVGPEYFDDFDPKWWEAVKEVTPNPFAPSDPRDTATDVAVDWLPPALKWLINVTRAADKGMRAIKKHVVDRAMQGELFACYRTIRPSYPAVISRATAEAYEDQLSHILFDVVGSCHSANAAGFQASYGKVSNQEFRRLSRPVAVRFEVIYQIEDARNHRDARVDEHWAPVQDILARLKVRVNACIADRASKSR